MANNAANCEENSAVEELGERQGCIEGLQQALLRQMAHKFGPLPEQLLATVQAISEPERLEGLLNALLDATDLQSFRQHL